MSGDVWTRKRICSKCIEITSFVLLQYVQKYGSEKQVSNRDSILLASMVRAVNTAGAIERLYAERPYAEDMGTLLRSLAEMVINALYLQIAPDADVESYMNHDILMIEKGVRRAGEVFPEFDASFKAGTRSALAEKAAKVRAMTAGVASKTSWTKLDLHSRAVEVDKRLNVNITRFLSRVVYPYGHSFTHSTYDSLRSNIETFTTGEFPEGSVREQADHALFGTCNSLFIFSGGFSMLKDDNEFRAHMEIAHSLTAQYDAAPSIWSVQPES